MVTVKDRKWESMSHIRQRKSGRWQAIIRKKNYPDIVRTFLEKGTASKWSKLIETQMDKKVFQDMSGAESTTLSQLVIKYRDEVIPELKSRKSLTYKLNKLLKNKICYYKKNFNFFFFTIPKSYTKFLDPHMTQCELDSALVVGVIC